VNQSNFDQGGIFDLNLTLVLTSPVITGYAPNSPVHDSENATRTFSITIDRMVNVTWLIDGTEVSNESDVTYSSYTNTSATTGIWNISAIASNGNGTDMQIWVWHVAAPTSTPPAVFLIYGDVFYENNTQVDALYVVVTNLNTSREFVSENHSGSNFYKLITDGSKIHAGNVLFINAKKDGTSVGSMNHTITLNESHAGAVRVDINSGLADLQVRGIFPPQCIFDGRNNTINATIAK